MSDILSINPSTQTDNYPFPVTIRLDVAPAILKNSRQVVPVMRNGRLLRIPIKSKKAEAFMKAAAAAFEKQWGDRPPIDELVNIAFLFYGSWPDERSMPDLSNLYQAPEDALQAAGIIKDDTLIDSHAGSHRIPVCPYCPDRPILKSGPRKGQHKDSCGKKSACPYVGIDMIITKADRTDIPARAVSRCVRPSL